MELPPSEMDFPKEEEKILQLWKDLDAFKTSLKQSKGKQRFSFNDGPPFATGKPHYGHILAGTIKDIIPRWQHQHGFHVERRFGWDTHGLPVEYEIDKALNIKGPADVAKMGIENYNNECRKIVMRYSGEWEETVTRLGRWIDFKNDYKTMYPWYMESIWWVFKQLWDKGLIYKGFRVMPYSTGCCTPLANFEATQEYKDVNDPAVIITFPMDDDPETSLIAWTTTPWTLPSNMALCVHPDSEYVKVKDHSNDKVYIMMKPRLSALFKSEKDYTIIDTFKGITLKNKGYKPIFPYFEEYNKNKQAFRVLCDTYVTEESGTGVVHQAPYFGEDDNRVCLAAGVISRDQEIVCPLDAVGQFTDPVTDFKGMYVKDADKEIIKKLKEMGRLVSASQIKHSYPFCWRSDTPLLYRAVPSWFMRVQQMQSSLLEKNDETYWVPDSIKEGRFANWLRDARDWNLSRNRYWGTPIPVWTSEDGEEMVCIGSIDELYQLSGVKVEDLHRETVDKITIPSARKGQPPLKRISEVFDCWFESGSMPYAQMHYPFENKKEFEESFPADFIAEGTDQTRGWFYTLLVLSTALFNKPAWKNLIVNGLVLASDGQKMSKRKQNYPDPNIVINKYGADALRLFLINSPVVKAESLRFKEEGVRDVLKDVFLPWYNAYRFLLQNIDGYQKQHSVSYVWSESSYGQSDNVMDKWIISFTQSLLVFVKREMAAYRLYTVLPRLMKFIDNLTNWYVRTNRKRLKGEGNSQQDCLNAIHTLFSVVFTMVRVFAPFTPFLTENMYQKLKPMVEGYAEDKDKASVHFLMIPAPRMDLIDLQIERSVARMQTVIDLGRVVRDRKTMPVKYPLPELVLIHKDQQCLNDVKALQEYVLDELNIKRMTLSTDKQQYGVLLRAEPDHKTLGARLKGAFKAVTQEIKALGDEEVTKFVNDGKMTLLGNELGPDDIRVMYTFAGDESLSEKYEAHSDSDLLILLDCHPDQAMMDEGLSREIQIRLQKLRKTAKLIPSDEVTCFYDIQPPGSDLERVLKTFQDTLETATKSPLRLLSTKSGAEIAKDEYSLKGSKMSLVLCRGFPSDHIPASSAARRNFDNGSPDCAFVNVEFMGSLGVVLLENPIGQNKITKVEQLEEEAKRVFGLDCDQVSLNLSGNPVSAAVNAKTLNGQTLSVCKSGQSPRASVLAIKGSCCRFITVKKAKAVGALLLENPVDECLASVSGQVLKAVFGGNVALFEDEAKKRPVKAMLNAASNGKTFYA